MTKHEIAAELAERINIDGFGLAAALHAVDHIADIVAESIERQEPVYIRGFATIKPIVRRARKARDISAGKVIAIPPRATVKLIPSKILLKRLNP